MRSFLLSAAALCLTCAFIGCDAPVEPPKAGTPATPPATTPAEKPKENMEPTTPAPAPTPTPAPDKPAEPKP
jgi:hypothetical protein